jgi:hypothetical protein
MYTVVCIEEETEQKRELGSTVRRCEDVKNGLKETGWESVLWINLARYPDR